MKIHGGKIIVRMCVGGRKGVPLFFKECDLLFFFASFSSFFVFFFSSVSSLLGFFFFFFSLSSGIRKRDTTVPPPLNTNFLSKPPLPHAKIGSNLGHKHTHAQTRAHVTGTQKPRKHSPTPGLEKTLQKKIHITWWLVGRREEVRRYVFVR